MQPFETWLKADLQAPVTVKRIDGNLFSGDNQGNLVGVTVTDAGEPATLSGDVRGYFIRSDGNTVIMSGTIDGNKVTVVLPSACYTVVGQFSLVIKVGQVAVGACTGYVYQSNTDSTVDPEHVIPDIDQLLTRVEALEGRATTLEGDVSAQNNTINAIEDGLAIIATGNVHPAIANGQFVYVKGHSSLAEGLYRATAAIGTNATLSTSNLTADGSGGLNALKGDLDSLNSNISSLIISEATDISNSESIPANSTKRFDIPIGKTGYTPVGVAWITGLNTTGLVLQEYLITESKKYVWIYFRNALGTAMTPSKITAVILYAKSIA